MTKKVNLEVLEDEAKNISLRLSEIESLAYVIIVALENDFNEIEQKNIKNAMCILNENFSNVVKDYDEFICKMGF